MNRADFRFLDRLRVRWAEVDMQKIVFNGHYLMYFDTAVASYWRALALPYHETMEHLQGDLFVRKATVEYHGSARYDDLCEVGLRCGRIGKSSMTFDAALFRGDALLVGGELVYVFADPVAMSSKPVPDALRTVLQEFEAGAPMLSLHAGAWPQLGPDAKALRQQVFGVEMGLDGLAEDPADTAATHVVARNRLGMAVGTGRLTVDGAGMARIGRLAVAQPLRGSGVGRRLLGALVDAARDAGARMAELDAASASVSFYRSAGFEAAGPAVQIAGLPHQPMQRSL